MMLPKLRRAISSVWSRFLAQFLLRVGFLWIAAIALLYVFAMFPINAMKPIYEGF
jgi:hypothetical protein